MIQTHAIWLWNDLIRRKDALTSLGGAALVAGASDLNPSALCQKEHRSYGQERAKAELAAKLLREIADSLVGIEVCARLPDPITTVGDLVAVLKTYPQEDDLRIDCHGAHKIRTIILNDRDREVWLKV